MALLLSGLVKGILSLGLPLVGMPLLTLVVDVPTAVAILMIPLVLSNLIQAIEGRGTLVMLKRFWPLIICLIGGTFIGTALFAALDRQVLLLTVGVLGDRAVHLLDPAAACDDRPPPGALARPADRICLGRDRRHVHFVRAAARGLCGRAEAAARRFRQGDLAALSDRARYA